VILKATDGTEVRITGVSTGTEYSLSIERLAQAVGATIIGRGGGGAAITGVSIDSRTIKPGDCFFAIAGERFDGHEYVGDALAKGAACAVVDRSVDAAGTSGRPILRVADTVKALGDLARAYRRTHPFKVIAITGSVGKTTTRQIVHHVLSRNFRTHQAQRSFNNSIGLPLTLLAAEPGDEIIISELGANHPGEIAELTRIAEPDIAVVTNAHPAHLEGFGDLATIIREKLSIAEGLPDNGTLVINGDIEPLVTACRSTGRPFRTFGRSSHVDYRAESIACEALHSTFTIDGRQVRLPLPGPGNVENALAAWAACDLFGLTVEAFAEALRDLSGVSMRAELLHVGTLTVLNDCYNANPASMKNALVMLHNLRSRDGEGRDRRLVFICGEMAELGSQSETLHADLGRAVAEAGVDLLVTVGDPPRTTARTAREASRHNLQTMSFEDAPRVCGRLQEFVRKDDIILVKGSRTARLERVVQELIKDNG